MSASHKPSLHLSELTGTVYLGRASKADPGVLIGDPIDVTARFIGTMLAKFGPVEPETTATTELVSTDPAAPKYKVTIERIEG